MLTVKQVLGLMHTKELFVCDPFLSKLAGKPMFYPLFLERLLIRRGQWNDELSLGENIEKHYGKKVLEAIIANT